MQSDILSTDLLVLRKIPHLGANLIINGISPKYGKMSFFLKNAVSSQSKFNTFDVFRLLEIQFRNGTGDLAKCLEADIIADYSGVASTYDTFTAACNLSKFCLDNILPDDSQPRVFQAVCVALKRMADNLQHPPAALTGFALCYLLESGLLDSASMSSRDQAQCRMLLEMSQGGDMPPLTEENWQNLWLWTQEQLKRAEVPFPAQN